MNRNRRIFFLLLINLGLSFVSLYVLDLLQIIDYKQILSRVPFIRQTYAVKIEDPYLLEKVELEKKWQILDEKILNYSQDKKKMEEDIRTVLLEKENIAREKESVKNMIDEFEKMKADKESYDKRVEAVAIQIESMPPKSSVSILEKQDDLMIIDIFKKMEARARDEGKVSLVSTLLMNMDPEQAARVQRKMLE